MKIGYARVSTSQQDLTDQLDAVETLGVGYPHTCVDHGLTGSGRARPGLTKALAAGRADDRLVVAKLFPPGRSTRDAHGIATEFADKGVALSLGGRVYEPTDATVTLFSVLKIVVEFGADDIRHRKGKEVARAMGRLRSKKPKLSYTQEKHRVALYKAREYPTERADYSSAVRSPAYRAVERAGKHW
jgi:DNA invertase Pin-like site-specific DNA recombinase